MAEQTTYEEGLALDEYLDDLWQDNNELRKQVDILTEFLSWKGIEEEYWYFKEHAHWVQGPDDPFPYLTL